MPAILSLWQRWKSARRLLLAVLSGCILVLVAAWARLLRFSLAPHVYGSVEIVGAVLALTFAANALIRYRGTRDRVSLILALGFTIAVLIECFGLFEFARHLGTRQGIAPRVTLAWMLSRTVLALLMLAALAIERRLPRAREPAREITAAFLIVSVVAYITCAVFLSFPSEQPIRPAAWLARPWDLLPAGLYLIAFEGFRRRRAKVETAMDRVLVGAAWMNFAAHLVVTQSAHQLDAPFALAVVLKCLSYALLLGGTLLDNARLFDQVRRQADSDPLTGLANYRRLINAIDGEIERSGRSGRPFTILLLDLDGLKQINDRYGHLTGSRAICRTGNLLRLNCRAIDTAARYGGDEFALVLPETREEDARQVAARICETLARETEKPALSVSVGLASYARHGASTEQLLNAADRALYEMKTRNKQEREPAIVR
ncbi:MAG: diguanylate cyclase [Candidatus Acidiferrales bacterium]